MSKSHSSLTSTPLMTMAIPNSIKIKNNIKENKNEIKKYYENYEKQFKTYGNLLPTLLGITKNECYRTQC